MYRRIDDVKVTFATQFPALSAPDPGYSCGIHLHSVECASVLFLH